MTKKVKFASLAEEEEFYQEFDKEIDAEGDEGNDLDLDTIRARSKLRQIKNIDEADEESDLEEAVEQVNESIKEEGVVNWDTESENESEAEQSIEEDDREIPLEPFNLKGDREEGNFDADGFFVRNVDEDADQDRWLANLTRSDIAKARRAHENQISKEKPVEESLSLRQIYTELLSLMQPGQSVLSAIRSKSTNSPSANSTRGPPPNKNRLKKMMAAQASNTPENSEADSQKKREMNRLTELADMLMNRGNFGVYEETFEDISQRLKSWTILSNKSV